MNKTTTKYFIAAGITFISIFFACNGSDKKGEIPKEGSVRLVGVYIKRDGNKQIDILLRQISKKVKFDSVKKFDTIVYDTLVGIPIIVKAVDSAGHFIKTKAGTDSLNPNPYYIPIGKDSVNFNISNIPVDSLLRK